MIPPPDRAEGPTTLTLAGRADAPLLVERFPAEVPFGLLGRLAPLSERVDIDLELHRIPRQDALDLLRRAGAAAETELASGEADPSTPPSELEHEAESAADLGRRVASSEQDLFRVGWVAVARARTRESAERLRTVFLDRARGFGLRLTRPFFEAALAAQAPTLTGVDRRPSHYWHTLPTDGVAAFFPFVDEGVAEEGGILVGLLLDDAAPVFLDRYRQTSHSWGIFGATGSGKSFLASLIALRTRWMTPELDLVLVDPLGEFGGLARALGGDVVRLGRDGSARLNPLDPRTTGGDPAEKAARVGAFLRALWPSLRDEEGAALDAALQRLLTSGTAEPTFGDLADEVGRRGDSGRLLTLLEVFRSGSLAGLNGPTTVDWLRGPTAIDLSGAPDSHLAFHLAYVLDAVLGRLRTRRGPKLVVVDEAHLLARDPATAAFLDRLVRHIRHYEAGVVLLSQNPDDFLQSESGRSLLRNLRASFFLRLPEVSRATREFFDLTTAEAEWLPHTRLPREAGYAEGLLRLGPAHLPIAVVASTPEYDLLTAGPPSAPDGT